MKRFRLSLLFALTTTFFSNATFAAAYQLYEIGAPVVGTAGVGQAVVHDASISYFNPAGMPYLEGNEFLLGSQVLVSYVAFEKNSSNTISGDNGTNAGVIVPGVDVFFVYKDSPQLTFG